MWWFIVINGYYWIIIILRWLKFYFWDIWIVHIAGKKEKQADTCQHLAIAGNVEKSKVSFIKIGISYSILNKIKNGL